MKVLRLRPERRFCRLGDLSKEEPGDSWAENGTVVVSKDFIGFFQDFIGLFRILIGFQWNFIGFDSFFDVA